MVMQVVQVVQLINYLLSKERICIASSLELPQNSGSALKSEQTFGLSGVLYIEHLLS